MPPKQKPAPRSPEETLEALLDKVSITRDQLHTIERSLERLRTDIAKSEKQKDGSRKSR
jgi:predicted  nucleic acid-binding Zn-ribbon protein